MEQLSLHVSDTQRAGDNGDQGPLPDEDVSMEDDSVGRGAQLEVVGRTAQVDGGNGESSVNLIIPETTTSFHTPR